MLVHYFCMYGSDAQAPKIRTTLLPPLLGRLTIKRTITNHNHKPQEHDLIHDLYFKRQKWVQDAMFAFIWVIKSNANPWCVRTSACFFCLFDGSCGRRHAHQP